MALNISKRQVEDATILDLNGRITLREGSVRLGDLVHDLACEGTKKIVLNFAQVSYLDSSGMGELVSAHMTLRNRGGELTLYGVNKKLQELLDMTSLSSVLDIKENEKAAVTSAKAASA